VRALWLQDRRLRLRDDVALPEPPPGEARVRVLAAGVCNTDLELVRGYYPYAGVPGHEFVGRVEAAPGAEQWLGRRVVGEINAVCGRCATCRAGRPTHCESRTVLGIVGRDGAFAEHLTLPVANLHALPESVPDDVAVFVEPTAAALEVQHQVRIGPGDDVVVLGDGKLGNLVAQTLALTGCRLLVVGRHRSKLELLASRGIRTTTLADAAAGRADVVVECTGRSEGLTLARRLVRPRGTIVLKSTYAGERRLDFSSLVVDEVTLVGSRCGPFAPALDLLARGAVDVRPLIHARFPLADGVVAFEEAARPGVMKVLVEP
jgi:threonine dehydrogenase-like Zn-dependent dehydrogenase